MVGKVPVMEIVHVDFSLEEIVGIPTHDQEYVGAMLVEQAKGEIGFYDWQYCEATMSDSPMEGKTIRITLAKVVLEDSISAMLEEMAP